ncbi:MAG: aminotransferase class V-fold PLP-dependent enzyme [Acidobacteriota bacterium]
MIETALEATPQPADKAPSPAEIERLCSLFEPAPGSVYLDSATYGLPPRPTLDALDRAREQWRGGTGRWVDDWDREGDACRRLFADLIGARAIDVALVPAVSMASGIVATAVPQGGEVLIAEGDFTSLSYPFLAAAERGLLSVREAPLDELADAVSPRTRLVAVSLVQSSDGRLAKTPDIASAARAAGALLYLDATQAVGTLPVDVEALGADFLACGGYKWLCCPRGVGFLWIRKSCETAAWPAAAGWRSADLPYARFYGSPLHLAEGAARFDLSLAWHAWVGARPSLEVMTALGDETRFRMGHAGAVAIADRLDLERPETCILSVPVRDPDAAFEALEARSVRASKRAGHLRVATHFYTPVDQAERAAELLRPFR